MRNAPIVCGYRCKGLWWFRVLGYGLHYKNTRLHPLLFSERTGHRKKLKIGRFSFGFLKPEKHMIMTSRGSGRMEEYRQYYKRGSE